MSTRPPADWMVGIVNLLLERPDLEGVGISYAATAAVSA